MNSKQGTPRTLKKKPVIENIRCGKCDQDVGKKEHKVQCGMCELWHHTSCEGVPGALYKALQEREQSKAQGLHWFCVKCNRFATGFMAGLSRLAARQDALENRVKEIEEKSDKRFQEIEKSQDTVLHKIENVAVNCIKEMEDRDQRKCNIVMNGIEESTSTDANERKREDIEKAKYVTRKGLECEIDISQTFRLGERKTERTNSKKNPRPLLVKLKDTQQASNVLRLGRKLRDQTEFQSIYIKKDMTFLERSQMRELVIQRNEKREESKAKGEESLWVIRDNRIINIARQTQPRTGEETMKD